MIEYNKLFSDFVNTFSELSKADNSIEKLIGLSKPKEDKKYPAHVYLDTAVPLAGNRFAYNNFLHDHAHSGVFIFIDALDMDALNTEYGNETGDKAIEAMFEIIYQTNSDLNLFRVKGDLALVYANTPEEAKKFLEDLSKNLEKTANLINDFKLSFAIGVGYGKEKAWLALSFAKRQLNKSQEGIQLKVNPPGKNPTVIHSLLNESPPQGWFITPKLYTGEYYIPHEAVINTGLKLHNPLKTL